MKSLLASRIMILPLDAISNAIEIDLLQMNDQSDLPARRVPDKCYQLT